MLKILSIMRNALPKDANLDADVDHIMRSCVAKFTGHLISEAKEQRTLAKHRKLQSEDIISALRILGFEDASNALSRFCSRLSDGSIEKVKIGHTDIHSPVHNSEPNKSPVHNSEPNHSPVHNFVHNSEPNQSPVHNSEPNKSPVHNSEPNQSPAHNSVYNSEPNLSAVHNFVYNSEPNQSPVHNFVHNSEPNQSPMHNFVYNSEPNQSPVHNSEPLPNEILQLKGGGDVIIERAVGSNEGNATMHHASEIIIRSDAKYTKQVPKQQAEPFDASSPVTMSADDHPGSSSGTDLDAVMSDADLADAIELLKQYGVYSDVA